MKKRLLILALLLVLPNMAFAKCDGGKIIIGNNNKHNYCISKKTMNWWSAVAWCEANDRHLATKDEACNGGCSNMNVGVNKGAWIAKTSGTDGANRIHLMTDHLVTSKLTYSGNVALCY